MKRFPWLMYLILFVALLLVDRFSKQWALAACVNGFRIFWIVSCDLAFNRGISWGMFQATHDWSFIAQSSAIGIILCILGWYTYKRYRSGSQCLGEVFVIAGGIGNMIDRISYGAVVDFILLSYKGYQFPTFNVADSMIVVGVFLMIFQEYFDA